MQTGKGCFPWRSCARNKVCCAGTLTERGPNAKGNCMALTIDTSAIVSNWRTLAAMTPGAACSAVLKADAYGLGAPAVIRALAEAGLAEAFVFTASEGQALRRHFGGRIFVLEGHRPGADLDGLMPCLVSPEQFFRDRAVRPGQPFAVQIDTGMNRLGLSADEWRSLRSEILAEGPALLMSHLACADEPDHSMTTRQRERFVSMTNGTGVRRSLAATAGILCGQDYAFDLTRPGIGLYGGMDFEGMRPVVQLALPVLRVLRVRAGEGVGYGATWIAPRDSRIATVAGGYADGIQRRLGESGLALWAGDRRCPLVGRISMDVLAVDVTDVPDVPDTLELIGPHQGLDVVARHAGTITYEVLTSLGNRYTRRVL